MDFLDPLTEETIRRNLDEEEEIEGESLAPHDAAPVVLSPPGALPFSCTSLLIACSPAAAAALYPHCAAHGTFKGRILQLNQNVAGLSLGGAASDPTCTLFQLPDGIGCALVQYQVPPETLKLFVRTLFEAFSGVTSVILVGEGGPRDVLGAAARSVVAFDRNEDSWYALSSGSSAESLALAKAHRVLPLPSASIIRGLFAAVASHCLARSIAFKGLLQVRTGLVTAGEGGRASTGSIRLAAEFFGVAAATAPALAGPGRSKGAGDVEGAAIASSAAATLVYS